MTLYNKRKPKRDLSFNWKVKQRRTKRNWNDASRFKMFFFLWPPLKFSSRFVVAVFDWYSRLMHLTEQQGTNCYENNTKENLTFRFFVMDVWSSDTYYDGIWDPSLEFHQFFSFQPFPILFNTLNLHVGLVCCCCFPNHALDHKFEKTKDSARTKWR